MRTLLSPRNILLGIAIMLVLLAGLQHIEPIANQPWFAAFNQRTNTEQKPVATGTTEVISEESAIIRVVEESLPSVVTIAIEYTTQRGGRIELDPFDPFGPFRRIPGREETVEQNIGSGFIISSDGLVITNKHVVLEKDAKYTVVTNDRKEYQVENIYRDPLNDLAILKINASGLKPLALAETSKLKLGQLAIAIGTPLGEFQNTITTGIVSGLGRGITAGSPFEGFVERLDNVIQTDAAISPGNSGGPLLNSSGQVIGVNTAVSREGQNIGFAIPADVVGELLQTFNDQGGRFERPYIGVRYTMLTTDDAEMEDMVPGAYVESVERGSPAEDAGVRPGDIITAIDGKKLDPEDPRSLAQSVVRRRIGDTIEIEVWRDGEVKNLSLILAAYQE